MEDVMAAAGTSPLSAGPPPARVARWRRRFPGDEREMRAVRRWLESVLAPCPARDDVMSVAIELAANAVRHTASGRGGTFAVEIAWRPGLVRVAVADGGAPGGPRVTNDPDSESGRGLVMVRGLSLRSGASGDARGRIVWADLAWDGPPPDAVAGKGANAGCGAATSVDADAGRDAAVSVGTYACVSATADVGAGAWGRAVAIGADVGDSAAALGRRFGVPVWAGRFTGQWWALADEELVCAPSAPELAGLLARLLTPASGSWRESG